MDVQKQYPFETIAVCVLPNHIHAIWMLPPDDADYSLRWRLIKPNSPHIFLMPRTCLPANSGGTNAVFGSGVFTNTPSATKPIYSVVPTISITIPSNTAAPQACTTGRFPASTATSATACSRPTGAAHPKPPIWILANNRVFKTNPFRRPQTSSETACVGCVALPRTRSPNTPCMPAFSAHRSIRQTKQPA